MTRFAALFVAAVSTYFATVAGVVRWAIWTRNFGSRSMTRSFSSAMSFRFRSRAAVSIVMLTRSSSMVTESALADSSRLAMVC